MKTKIMTLILAACLGLSGMTVYANGQPDHYCCGECDCRCTCGCDGPHKLTEVIIDDHYSEYNGYEHQHITVIKYMCNKCTYSNTSESVVNEAHDYEQIYYDDGRVLSYCTGCGDSFFW